MTYYFEVNGVSFGSSLPVERISQLLPTQKMFDFGRFPAGTFITPTIQHFTTYTNGFPDVDLIQEPIAIESITFTVNTETGQYEPGYIVMSIQELLHHIDGTFSSGEIGAGEGAVLSLSPVAADGTPVGMVGDVEIGVSTDAGIQFVNPDRVDESGYYYLWSNAINGINVIGNEIYGSGDYNYGNVYIWNGSTDVTTSTAIGVQTEQLCAEPKASKDTIGTGKTVSINIIGHNKHEQIASFPDWQIFNIWITKGEQYGQLISPWGDIGSIVMGPQPFVFQAADSIDMDTVVVQIKVQPVYGGGGASSIGVVTKDTLRSHAPLIMSKQTNANNIAAVPTETNKISIEQTINSLQDQLKNESKKKGREKQQEKLAISIEQLKAMRAYQTAKTPAEKQTALASMKKLAMLATEATECKTTADVTIKKENKFTGFSQDDTSWAGKDYDTDIDTAATRKNGYPTYHKIGEMGCALCEMASVLKLLGYDDVTPLTLNTWMVENYYYNPGGGVIWDAVTDYATEHMFPYIISYPERDDEGQLHKDKNNTKKLIGTPITLDKIDTYLNNGYYIVAEVKNIHDDMYMSEHTHFVRIESKENGNYSIHDPGYGDRTTLSSYNNQIYKTIVYIIYK